MERKSYTEYRRYTPVEPPSLYYLILSVIVILVAVFINGTCYLVSDTDSSTDFLLYAIIESVALLYFFPYKMSHERTLIHHNNDIIEIFLFNRKHQTIPISEISQVSYVKRWTLCRDIIILVLETTQNKKVKLMLKENKEFLAELKKHNPNIIVPELPEI
jgi:hypothetical protein